MKLIFTMFLTSFLFIPTSQANSEPIFYYGTCSMYDGAFTPSKAPAYHFYLTLQGQVLPSWPFSFPGNDDRFRVNLNGLNVYTIYNEDQKEVLAEQSIHDGTALDLRYQDSVSGWSIRCVKTQLP